MSVTKRKRMNRIRWLIGVLGSVVVLLLTIFPSWVTILKDLFTRTVRATVEVVVSEPGFSAFPNAQPLAAFPLGLWIFVSVTNETSADLTLEGYKVEVERPGHGWVEIPRILFNSGGCIGAADRRFDLPDGIFDENAMKSGGIPPGHRIEGWVFFGRPDWVKDAQSKRLVIYDSTGGVTKVLLDAEAFQHSPIVPYRRLQLHNSRQPCS